MSASNDFEKETVLFLLGKTGVGKSSTGNTIIGEDRFQTSDCAQSVTTDIQVEWARRQGRIIKVVDGPGLFDTELEEGEAAEKMACNTTAAFLLCPGGFHSLVLVIKYGVRFTMEEQRVVTALKEIFGPDFVRDFCTIIVTYGDNFDFRNNRTPQRTFQDWCHQQGGEMQKLFQECEYRVVLFHNVDPEKQESDLTSLLNTVDALRNKGVRYTNELFEQAAATREQFVVKANAPLLREKMQCKLDLLVQDLNETKKHDGKPKDLKKLLDVVMADAGSLLIEIDREDKDTRVLETLKKTVTKIKDEVREIQMATITTEMEMREKLTAVAPLQAELEEESYNAKKFLIRSVIATVARLLAKPVALVGGFIAGGAAFVAGESLKAAGHVKAGSFVSSIGKRLVTRVYTTFSKMLKGTE